MILPSSACRTWRPEDAAHIGAPAGHRSATPPLGTRSNPTRTDHRPGSFKVNLRTGRWGDFSTGDKGGDLIALAAFLHTNGDMGEAARSVPIPSSCSPVNKERASRRSRAWCEAWSTPTPRPSAPCRRMTVTSSSAQ
ncbi:hypothetical protein EYW49_07380 [Siculibacillus lacustris]|uniref:Uncharacterized protein n=1 Tax=Siculibacillus lacustris TaxID=1549641 RepID=A0A4Q9VTC2_9HYPH|nr:hypothetical protein EYW49_07380 [Siculibacillus lacustris]